MELKRAKEVLDQRNLIDELRKENEQMRGLLLWALYSHQGSSSEVGQPIRRFLGIGPHERMTKNQLTNGKVTAAFWMRDPEGVVGA